MSTRVTRWGNSLAIRIPSAYARELHLDEGAEVELSVTEGRLVITPAPPQAYNLAELVAGITPENRHGETDWGGPVGDESW